MLILRRGMNGDHDKWLAGFIILEHLEFMMQGHINLKQRIHHITEDNSVHAMQHLLLRRLCYNEYNDRKHAEIFTDTAYLCCSE